MASADQGDLFNLLLSSKTTYDSNLFRLPDGAVPSSLQGSSERSDIINKSSIGFTLDKQYALQGIHIDYRITSNKYQNYKYLDFDAKNYNLAWNWAITPELTGTLSKTQNQFLVTFEDNRNPTQIILTTENNNIDFDYSPHGIWHVIGSYSEGSSKNSQTFLPQASNSTKNIQGGLKYVFGSGSFVSGEFVDTTAQYLGQNSDTGFTKQSEIINGLWVLSGKSNVNFQLANTDYKSNNFSERNFSGFYGFVNYEWNILPKTSLVFNLGRTLGSYITSQSSYTTIDSIGVVPTWHISEKVLLSSNLDISQRKFLGEGPIVATTQRSDKTLRYGLNMGWSPRSYVSTSLSLQHQERNSNFNNFDYSDNTISVSAQLDF